MAFTTTAGAARFEGDFALENSQGPITQQEQAYLDVVTRVLDALADDAAADLLPDRNFGDAVKARRQELRRLSADAMKHEADEFAAGKLAPDIAADNTFVLKGRYRAEIDRLDKQLFIIRIISDNDQKATDLNIEINSFLPSAVAQPSPAQEKLFVDVSAALTTIRTVYERQIERAERRVKLPGAAEHETKRARSQRDLYVRKLGGICEVGLEGPQTQLASTALTGLRVEFVAQEAPRLKNAYVRSLGFAAGLAALFFFILYGVFGASGFDGFALQTHRIFLIAAAGAAVGSWMSFSVRRVTLGFDDLAVLEEDMLEPSIRIVFVVLLTMTVCLLFWTQTTNIEIGGLKTSALLKPADPAIGMVALIVGIFCGLSERALATAISGRAGAFVRGVAGQN